MKRNEIKELISSYKPYIDGLETIIQSGKSVASVAVGTSDGSHPKIVVTNSKKEKDCVRYSHNLKSTIKEVLRANNINTDGLKPSNDIISQKILNQSLEGIDGFGMLLFPSRLGNPMKCFIWGLEFSETGETLFAAFQAAILKLFALSS